MYIVICRKPSQQRRHRFFHIQPKIAWRQPLFVSIYTYITDIIFLLCISASYINNSIILSFIFVEDGVFRERLIWFMHHLFSPQYRLIFKIYYFAIYICNKQHLCIIYSKLKTSNLYIWQKFKNLNHLSTPAQFLKNQNSLWLVFSLRFLHITVVVCYVLIFFFFWTIIRLLLFLLNVYKVKLKAKYSII